MALGLMHGDPRLASLTIATNVISQPRSSFEQWHALRVCREIVRRGATADQHQAIRDAIAVARRNGTLVTGDDFSRERIAREIESMMGGRETTTAR